jgi:hypothetical protein
MSKAKQAIISCAIGLLMLSAATTYAWTSYSNAFLSVFSGSSGLILGGTTHDDFSEPNKDVYIENWGNLPIVVRVRLFEYIWKSETRRARMTQARSWK